MATLSSQDTVCFGLFELDLKAQQLRRKGLPVRLTQQPLQLLTILLERPGDVFTREELRQRMWASDVFVDFDHGLNKSVQKLREALGDSSESPRYIETVLRTGYRFIAPVKCEPTVTISEPLVDPTESPQSTPTAIPDEKALRPQKTLLIFGFAILAVVLVWLLVRHVHATEPIRSLAVLPLDNLSGDPNQEYFADGMTDELITELAHIPNLRVVSRTSVMQTKGIHKSLKELADELDVDAIVEGSIVRAGDRVRITAQLIDARNDRHLWSQSFEGQVNDILSLQDSVASEIATKAKVVLRPEAGTAEKGIQSIDPVAHEAYLRGRYFLQKREAIKSVEYFQQAISLNPSYSSAYAGLADALEAEYTLGKTQGVDVMPQALAAAKRAIELDPKNGEAYISLAGLESTYEWDWPAAQQNFIRGIDLSPSYSLGEIKYAIHLDAMNRPEEAVAHMRRAMKLDPLSFFATRQMGSTLYFARHYDEALVSLRRADEMEPRMNALVDSWISWVYEQKGEKDKAVEYDLSALQSNWTEADINNLRTAYRKNGWAAYWKERIVLQALRPAGTCTQYGFGMSYLQLGDLDKAFLSLNRAIDQRCYWMGMTRVDPRFDVVRKDTRYTDLVQRMHLPQ